jgi:uncharacterized protein (TIGR03437 family)
MRKSLFVSICWLVGCLVIAQPSQAQPLPGRVIDLNGQAVSGVEITAKAVCTSPPGPRPSTFESQPVVIQTDANGVFEWKDFSSSFGTGTCGTIITSYQFKKDTYFFSRGGAFSHGVILFLSPLPNVVETRPAVVYASNLPKWASVSAANYAADLLTNEMIMAGFGSGIGTATMAATTLPLPTTLSGRKVMVRDLNGKEAAAQMLFVSPNQINFVTPSGLAEGPCVVRLLDSGNNLLRVDLPVIVATRPGLFTANADGKGVPAANILRVKSNNVQSIEPLAEYDQQQKKWVPLPIDLGPEGDRVFLVLYGTGWRNVPSPQTVVVRLGGVPCEVTYVGRQPDLAGLDQINALIPRTLIGRGDVNLDFSLILDGSSWPLKIK